MYIGTVKKEYAVVNNALRWVYTPTCSCGRVMLGRFATDTHPNPKGEAEGLLEKHMHSHFTAKRPPAGEQRLASNASSVPDASDDTVATDSVQSNVESDQGSRGIQIGTRDTLIITPQIIEQRWKLFTDDELILLAEDLNAEWESETEDMRPNHANTKILDLLQPLVIEVNAEITRRNI